MINKCRAKVYTDNEVIFHGSIMCWGFGDQPRCKYLEECLNDYIEILPKRKINTLNKKFGFKLENKNVKTIKK
jgi:hypothetical protein